MASFGVLKLSFDPCVIIRRELERIEWIIFQVINGVFPSLLSIRVRTGLTSLHYSVPDNINNNFFKFLTS